MEIKLTVRPEVIAALRLFTAHSSRNPLLHGIYLEVTSSQTLLVASGESHMACYRLATPQPVRAGETAGAILPSNNLGLLSDRGAEVTIALGEGHVLDGWTAYKRQFTVRQGSMEYTGVTIDSAYPNFRKAFPLTVSGEVAQFDLRLLDCFRKAQLLLIGRAKKWPYTPYVRHNGSGVALVYVGDDNFVGALAPMLVPLNSSVKDAPPSWLMDGNENEEHVSCMPPA